MNIKKIKQPEGGLLQSKEWASVLRAEGKEVLIVADDENDTGLNCIINQLPVVGIYTYVPRVCDLNEQMLNELLDKSKQYAAKWMRVDICNNNILNLLDAKNIKYEKAPHNMQPVENLIIDINITEDELLAQMKSKTRYNVRLAKKKGVKVFQTNEQKYLDIFYDLVEKTGQRKGVSFHNRNHYHKIFENISSEKVMLFVAEYKNSVIAANIISFYGGVATYLHGATSDDYRNVMAPFLLQWESIKEGKKRGCQWYDFGGIFLEDKDAGKKGITRFKMGFSPKAQIFHTLGSYDIILSNIQYKLYRILQTLK
jgi:lipid II:glycine glycyltransferase (peptidoglycan interpeptide bridge formation enzyme)